MQRIYENTALEQIPLFSEEEKMDLYTSIVSGSRIYAYSLYKYGAKIINNDSNLLEQYHKIPRQCASSSQGEEFDEDALHTIFILKIALDHVLPDTICEYYQNCMMSFVAARSSLRFPNGSKFCTDYALPVIISNYIHFTCHDTNSEHNVLRNKFYQCSSLEVEMHVMKHPEPGYRLILQGKILEFLAPFAENRDDNTLSRKRKRSEEMKEKRPTTSQLLEEMKNKLKKQKLQQHSSQKTTDTKTLLVNDFIDMIKITPNKAKRKAREGKIIELIADYATVDQFIEIAKAGQDIAATLAQSRQIIEFISTKATLDQFIEIIKADQETGKLLAMYPMVSRLVCVAEKLKMIMEINREIAEIMIPSLDVRVVKSFYNLESTRIKQLEQARAAQFFEMGMLHSEEYHPEILHAVGYIFVNDFKLIRDINFVHKTGKLIYTEIGKLLLDHLHGREASISRGLAMLIAKSQDLDLAKQSIFNMTIPDKSFEKVVNYYQANLKCAIEAFFPAETDQRKDIGDLFFKARQFLSPLDFDENQVNALNLSSTEKFIQHAVLELNRLNELYRRPSPTRQSM